MQRNLKPFVDWTNIDLGSSWVETVLSRTRDETVSDKTVRVGEDIHYVAAVDSVSCRRPWDYGPHFVLRLLAGNVLQSAGEVAVFCRGCSAGGVT